MSMLGALARSQKKSRLLNISRLGANRLLKLLTRLSPLPCLLQLMEVKISEMINQALEDRPLPQASKDQLSVSFMEFFTKALPHSLSKFGEHIMSNIGKLVGEKRPFEN